MKVVIYGLWMLIFSISISISICAHGASSVKEGVVKKAEVITTSVGKDGKPLLGAAVGVGIGSAFGSRS
jgi:hypothetical protein